jgi:ORF6N domain-containing protein
MGKAKPVDKANRTDVISVEQITNSILVFRGHKVLLDAELAELYGVPTKRLNEQVKRNAGRFPEDFLFRLTHAEVEALNRSHFATGSQKHRDPRFPPYAFTEHGAIMAAMILNSPRAVEMSVFVVRAFVKLRELLASNRELARRFEQLEARVEKLVAHDQALGVILSAIRKLMPPPPEPPKNRPIGFTADLGKET